MAKKSNRNTFTSIAEMEALGLRKNSDRIRFMRLRGAEIADIATALDIRYQHVRNVLLTEPKRPNTLDLVKLANSRADNPLVYGSILGFSFTEEEIEEYEQLKRKKA